ncbi:MAG TPA: T9SS type A sorting domain-containing protein, partial [Bacteroidota bacterium]|nr:T9SS type A sorting domain-containing protein [Bacteroidota bacterium]
GGEAFSTSVNQIISVLRTGQSMTIDSCLLNNTTQRHIYVNAAMKNVIITNSVFSDCGNLRSNNLGNGRAIDFRTVSVDSVFIQNCTFVNVHDRFIRHYGVGQAPIRNFTLDHCTIVNETAEHGCLGIGALSGRIQITNNLFVDNFVFGNDTTAYERDTEFGDTGELAPNGQYRMTFVGSVPTDTATIKWIVSNNYYSVSDSVQRFYNSRNGLPDQGIGNLIPLTWYINRKIVDSVNAFKKLATPITFTNVPKVPLDLARWFFVPIANGGSGKIKQNATFLAPYVNDYDRRETFYFRDTMNLAFATTSPAYNGALGGFPVGDLNWYPTQKTAWVTAGMPTTGVVKSNESLPGTFTLEQNYPNPFNPSTTLKFSLSKSSHVTLEVYNLLGQTVARLVDENLAAGTYHTNFDASNLSSGVYLYRLKAGDFVQTHKMVLTK